VSATPVWPRLGADEVHVWRAPLDVPSARLQRLRDVISTEERAIALGFRFQWESDRFAASRGWLRWLLGRYLEVAPRRLRLVTEPSGRPGLRQAPPDFRFAVSRSGAIALVAVTRGRDLGIDVELLHPLATRAPISGPEAAAVQGLAGEARLRALFAARTQRAAYAKAAGLDPGRLGELRHLPGPVEGFTVQALDAGPHYAAALATHGSAVIVQLDCDASWLIPPD
jgi:4'-phosphopantetheinyl transferase